MDEFNVPDKLQENGISILATDKEGTIVGAIMCYKTVAPDGDSASADNDGDVSDVLRDPDPRWSRLWPKRVRNLSKLMDYDRNHMRYDARLAMKDLSCQSVMTCEILCASSSCRGLGLGKALLQCSIDEAAKEESEVYFACVTGIYSQKIFKGFDFQVLKELNYVDMVDSDGEVLLKKVGEHISVQTVHKRLK